MPLESIFLAADWWARGIGFFGVVIAAGGLLLRGIEWYRSGHSSLKVIGSAGTITAGSAGPHVIRGERFGYDRVFLDVINTGRRPVTVVSVGFLHPDGARYCTITPSQPGQFPAKLDPGESTTVWSAELESLNDLVDWLRDEPKLRPFAKDAEGKSHRGESIITSRPYRNRFAALLESPGSHPHTKTC